MRLIFRSPPPFDRTDRFFVSFLACLFQSASDRLHIHGWVGPGRLMPDGRSPRLGLFKPSFVRALPVLPGLKPDSNRRLKSSDPSPAVHPIDATHGILLPVAGARNTLLDLRLTLTICCPVDFLKGACLGTCCYVVLLATFPSYLVLVASGSNLVLATYFLLLRGAACCFPAAT